MFTFNPGEAPATKSSMEFVASMLAILADPHGTATHLAEMQAKLDEIIELDAALRTNTAADAVSHKAAADALRDREAALEKREAALADIAAMTAEADRRTAAAVNAEGKSAIATAALVEREAAVSGMEKAAAIRMRELDSRSAGLDARDATLSAQEADLQDRLRKFKALMPA